MSCAQKRCSKCLIEQPLDAFRKDRNNKSTGVESQCKLCRKQYRVQNKLKNQQNAIADNGEARFRCSVCRQPKTRSEMVEDLGKVDGVDNRCYDCNRKRCKASGPSKARAASTSPTRAWLNSRDTNTCDSSTQDQAALRQLKRRCTPDGTLLSVPASSCPASPPRRPVTTQVLHSAPLSTLQPPFPVHQLPALDWPGHVSHVPALDWARHVSQLGVPAPQPMTTSMVQHRLPDEPHSAPMVAVKPEVHPTCAFPAHHGTQCSAPTPVVAPHQLQSLAHSNQQLSRSNNCLSSPFMPYAAMSTSGTDLGMPCALAEAQESRLPSSLDLNRMLLEAFPSQQPDVARVLQQPRSLPTLHTPAEPCIGLADSSDVAASRWLEQDSMPRSPSAPKQQPDAAATQGVPAATGQLFDAPPQHDTLQLNSFLEDTWQTKPVRGDSWSNLPSLNQHILDGEEAEPEPSAVTPHSDIPVPAITMQPCPQSPFIMSGCVHVKAEVAQPPPQHHTSTEMAVTLLSASLKTLMGESLCCRSADWAGVGHHATHVPGNQLPPLPAASEASAGFDSLHCC